MRVWLHHGPETARLVDVKKSMASMGPPRILVFQVGEAYYTCDGVHRLSAARALDFKPTFEVVASKHFDLLLDQVIPPDDEVFRDSTTVGEHVKFLVMHVKVNECPFLDFPDDCPRIAFELPECNGPSAIG